MNVENMKNLAKVRYERAVELDKVRKYLESEGVF